MLVFSMNSEIRFVLVYNLIIAKLLSLRLIDSVMISRHKLAASPLYQFESFSCCVLSCFSSVVPPAFTLSLPMLL